MLRAFVVLAATMGFWVPVALADAAAGEKKAELCLSCHRIDNSHGAPILDGLPVSYLLRQFEFFKSGKRFGPAMQTNLSSLSPEDLQDIADYFSSRPPTRAFPTMSIDQQAQELGSKIANDLDCARCHGENYRGTNEVPRLAGQHRNYLALHTTRLQRDLSLHPSMSSSSKPIPQPDIETMATFFGSLEP